MYLLNNIWHLNSGLSHAPEALNHYIRWVGKEAKGCYSITHLPPPHQNKFSLVNNFSFLASTSYNSHSFLFWSSSYVCLLFSFQHNPSIWIFIKAKINTLILSQAYPDNIIMRKIVKPLKEALSKDKGKKQPSYFSNFDMEISMWLSSTSMLLHIN